MTPSEAKTAPSRTDAEVALTRLQEMSAELRGAAILDASGEPLVATGPVERWAEPARGLLAAADEAAGEPVSQVHVGTEDGEAFAVRQDGLAAVVVAERFNLSSLMTFDMRSVLRDLALQGAAG